MSSILTAAAATSSLTLPSSNSPAHQGRPITTQASLSFDGVVRGEWIKLLSLRSIRWSVLVMLLVSWAGAALLAVAIADPSMVTPESLPALVAQSATFGSNITVLIMGVLGVLAITSEYSSGLILSTLTAVPRRTPVFIAKALVVAVIALSVGALSTFGGGAIAAMIFGDGAFAALVDPQVLVSLLGASLYLMFATLIAFGIGALLRSGAGAIATVVALLFISTLIFQILSVTGWAWVPEVAQWLPSDLGYELSTSQLTPAEFQGVGYWAALGGLAAWAAAMLIPAAVLFKTRDAK